MSSIPFRHLEVMALKETYYNYYYIHVLLTKNCNIAISVDLNDFSVTAT